MPGLTRNWSVSLGSEMQEGVTSGLNQTKAATLCPFCCCSRLNHILVITFMVSLSFAIIACNVIALTVFTQTRKFRTPQGYLKVSLAIADVMVGMLVVPFSIYTEISLMVTSVLPAWCQGGSRMSVGGLGGPWQPCRLIGPVFAGCTFVSISTIFLMALERSVAILRPLHKDAVVTRQRVLLLIFLSWVVSFLLALSPLVLSNGFTLEYNVCSRMCEYVPLLAGVGTVLLLFPAFDFTLLAATLVVNVLSLTFIRRYARKRKHLAEAVLGGDGGGAGGGSGGLYRPSFSDIKAAKTIGILTLAFAASFMPIAVFVLGSAVGYTWCTFSFFAFWILTANSCCNVIIYSARDRRFRKGVVLLFHRDRAPTSGTSGSFPSQHG